MTHRDRVGDPPGRRGAAGDAGHRQGFPTPSGGSPRRPERRLPKAFGRRRLRLAMPRIATPRAPGRKPWEAVSMSHYQRSLVSVRQAARPPDDPAPPPTDRAAPPCARVPSASPEDPPRHCRPMPQRGPSAPRSPASAVPPTHRRDRISPSGACSHWRQSSSRQRSQHQPSQASTPWPAAEPARNSRQPPRSSRAEKSRSCHGRDGRWRLRSAPRYRGASRARSAGSRKSRWRSSRSTAPASSEGDTAPSPCRDGSP